MGILNVTQIVFLMEELGFITHIAIQHAKDMVDQGADIIDLGGESTRPGHSYVDSDEELRRVIL